MSQPTELPFIANTSGKHLVFYHNETLANGARVRPLDPYSALFHKGPLYIGMPQATSQDQMLYIDDADLKAGEFVVDAKALPGLKLQRTSGKEGGSYLAISDLDDRAHDDDMTIRNVGQTLLQVNGANLAPGETTTLVPAASTLVTMAGNSEGVALTQLPPGSSRVYMGPDIGSSDTREIVIVTRQGSAPAYVAEAKIDETSYVGNETNLPFKFYYPDGTFVLCEAKKQKRVPAGPTSVSVIDNSDSQTRVPLQDGQAHVPLYGGGVAKVHYEPYANTYTISFSGLTMVNSTPLTPITVTPASGTPVTLYSGQRASLPYKSDFADITVGGYTFTNVPLNSNQVTQISRPDSEAGLTVRPVREHNSVTLQYSDKLDRVIIYSTCPAFYCPPAPGPASASSLGSTQKRKSAASRERHPAPNVKTTVPVYVWVLIALVAAGAVVVGIAYALTHKRRVSLR